jgi:hypothetical protein
MPSFTWQRLSAIPLARTNLSWQKRSMRIVIHRINSREEVENL